MTQKANCVEQDDMGEMFGSQIAASCYCSLIFVHRFCLCRKKCNNSTLCSKTLQTKKNIPQAIFLPDNAELIETGTSVCHSQGVWTHTDLWENAIVVLWSWAYTCIFPVKNSFCLMRNNYYVFSINSDFTVEGRGTITWNNLPSNMKNPKDGENVPENIWEKCHIIHI